MKNKSKFGMRVSFYNVNGGKLIFRNVTEVHYNYKSLTGEYSNRIAFESDIHSTGSTYNKDEIKEIEIVEDTEIAPRIFKS